MIRRSSPPIPPRLAPSIEPHGPYAQSALGHCMWHTYYYSLVGFWLQPDRLPVEIALETGQSEIALLLLSAGGGCQVVDIDALSSQQRAHYMRKRSQVGGSPACGCVCILMLSEAPMSSLVMMIDDDRSLPSRDTKPCRNRCQPLRRALRKDRRDRRDHVRV